MVICLYVLCEGTLHLFLFLLLWFTWLQSKYQKCWNSTKQFLSRKCQNYSKVVTCVADEGDSQGDDGVHEHPELQLLVSGEERNRLSVNLS